MKKIEDYLHLYLGCEVQLPISESPSTNGIKKLTAKLMNSLWDYNELYMCKPILRPLSDMSEEEKEKYWGNLHMPEDVRYLLSKHFDLFNLIGEELALDSTKITK